MTLRQRLATTAATAAFFAGILAPAASHAMMGGNGQSMNADFSSYSIEQLQTLIAKLQKIVEEMKKGSTCFVSDKDLSVGDGDGDELNADVRRLQEFLREKGFYAYKSTGYFGKATRTALVAYQKSVGIAETGSFDAATREKAHASYCKIVKKEKSGNGDAKKEGQSDKPAQPEGMGKPEQRNTVLNGVSSVKSITLRSEGDKVFWTIEGTAPLGFKVLWSKTTGPTYPPRSASDSAVYNGNPDARRAELGAFDGAGTYYARVCEYLGGKTGTCSNEIQVTL